MGTQFSWFYDLLIIIVVVGVTFRCFKRGFVSTVVGMVAVIVSFLLALFLSGLTAGAIYNGLIRNRAIDYIDQSLGGITDTAPLSMLPELDLSQIMLNEVSQSGELIRSTPLSDIDKTLDTVGKIDVNLNSVDLSGTGIDKLDLEFLGIDIEDLSSINAGRATITAAELVNNDFETLVLAKLLTNTLQNGAEFDALVGAVNAVGDFVPQISGSFSGAANDAITQVMVTIIESGRDGISAALVDNIIKPVILIPMRTLIFFILFVIICLVTSFIAKKLEIINRIPLVGGVNSFLGGLTGLLKSAVIILLVCIGLNILITITGNNIIFINTMTIEESFIFRHIYNFEFLSFAS
ncbi:MAG: CvpA family protein [Oscillospiraceae bacterium]|nr:CvpA family protein [Oscillospiraceae bacterium]